MRYVHGEMGKPFVWQERDCNTFALACISAMISNVLDLPCLSYYNQKTALAFAAQHSLRGVLESQLDAFPVEFRLCQRGDIAIVRRQGFECAHVVLGRYCVFPDFRAGVSLGNVEALPSETVFLRFD